MIKIKSYNRIWNVEGTLFAVGDVNLPFPVTFSQIIYFVASFILMQILYRFPPFTFLGSLVSCIVIPVLCTIGLNKIDFHGKKPPAYLLSYIMFFFRPKVTYRCKPVVNRRCCRFYKEITAVRSVTGNVLSD